MENKQTVTVIGAGLAGSEAAWQIAQAGYSVRLFEMKPQKDVYKRQSVYRANRKNHQP